MRPRLSLVVSAVVLATGLVSVKPAAPAAQCGVSEGYTLCVEAPDGALSGDVTVSATASGGSKAIAYVEFQWDTKRVLVDFWAPYNFTWPTQKYLDGTAPLKARVVTYPNEVKGSFVQLSVTLENGNDTFVPANPRDWATRFQPRPAAGSDPVIAAVGDAADGSLASDAVAVSIAAANPNLLLYLGDIYEYGTWPEWRAHYGVSSFDDPNGVGERWGAMASYTDYTLGNHEAHELATWRDYWHGRPNWRAYEYGGVFFLNLNSECGKIGGCDVGSPQYEFAEQALAANTVGCVVAYWHRPVLSAVADTAAMQPLWALIARNGGDLVLNGHTHTMQAFKPLNADLAAGQPDSHVVELVAGAGAHHMTGTLETDPRGAWQATKTPGAVFVTAVGGATGAASRLDWEFRRTDGETAVDANGVPRSGSMSCENPPPAPPRAEYVFTGSGTSGSFKSHSFNVTTVPKTLYVVLDWDNTSADLNLFLKNPAGTTVKYANGTAAKPEVVEYTAMTTGTWKANVSIKTGSASYELLVNPAEPPPEAEYVFTGSGSAGAFRSHPFQVSTVPKTLYVELDWDNANADLNLFLKAPNGTTVAFANRTTAKPEVVQYTATTAGTWKANVSIRAGTATYQVLVNPRGSIGFAQWTERPGRR